MKLYVVTATYNGELEKPAVFKTRREAEECADQYILKSMAFDYNHSSAFDNGYITPEVKRTLIGWAYSEGYTYYSNYYSSGLTEVETDVTEVDIEL